MRIVFDQSEAVAKWVAAHMRSAGYELGFGNCAAIGVEDDGQLIGGTVFHDWNPAANVIEMSSAATSPRWLCREMIAAIFGYVFNGVMCQCVVMRVHEDNAGMVDIARRFGFDEFFIPRLGGLDKGLFVFTLTREQWEASRFNRRKRQNG